MRRCLVLRFMSGSRGGGNNDNFKIRVPERAKTMDRWDGTMPADAGQWDTSSVSNFQSLMHSSLNKLKSGDMKLDMNYMMQGIPDEFRKNAEASLQKSPMGFGMMAFGVGENEKGKKCARAAKMVFDPASGEMKKEFRETQIEPDDVQLPKEKVENNDTSNCIEVELEEKPASSEGKHPK